MQARLQHDGLREITAPRLPGLAKNAWQRVRNRCNGECHSVCWLTAKRWSAFKDTESRLKRGQVAIRLLPGGHVEIRRIEIKELSGKGVAGNEVRQRRFVSLFNGKDLAGWERALKTVAVGRSKTGSWRAEGGAMGDQPCCSRNGKTSRTSACVPRSDTLMRVLATSNSDVALRPGATTGTSSIMGFGQRKPGAVIPSEVLQRHQTITTEPTCTFSYSLNRPHLE